MKTKQVIAMGGGGFSMEPENLLLDEYILTQVGKSIPQVCFLPTASSENADYIVRFYKAFTSLAAKPNHFSFFTPDTSDIEDFFLSQDVIYVGGGNTKTMLAIWREWQVDETLLKAYQQGVILAGLSAGAICWFEQGLTDSIPSSLTALPCLGFLPGSCAPHYDGEENRRPSYHQLIRDGAVMPGYGIEDSAAIHFIDKEVVRVVSSVEGKQAYYVEETGGETAETALETHYLGN
jgi:peptidase E